MMLYSNFVGVVNMFAFHIQQDFISPVGLGKMMRAESRPLGNFLNFTCSEVASAGVHTRF